MIGFILTLITGIWAAIMFILAQHKKEIWSTIEFKDDKERS